jgi:putative heme-binding domain-containing protein
MLTHLRALNSAAAASAPHGDVGDGAKLFEQHCTGCHRVNGHGGQLGPDLSRVGAARSALALSRKIRNPHQAFAAGYQPVTLVLADGARMSGVRKNEDTFSIQVMDVNERLQGYLKADVREVITESRSLMPAYEVARLPDADLNNLVTYLLTLRPSANRAPR